MNESNRFDVNNEINKLILRPKNTVKEKDLIDLLSKLNLNDALLTLGLSSIMLFREKLGEFINRGVAIDENGIGITQFQLCYLTNLLLISGSNFENNNHLSSNTNNVSLLCYIYNNILYSDGALAKKLLKTFYDFISFSIRMNYEQMPFQMKCERVYIARNLVMYLELLPKHLENHIELKKHNSLFKEININDYFNISSLIIMVAFSSRKTLVSFTLIELVEILENAFPVDILHKYLNLISIDIDKLRNIDYKMNYSLDPIFTKFRFNPLKTYPIVFIRDVYYIPNIVNFILNVFDLFWIYHCHFENIGLHMEFRKCMGKAFEEYIGRILKDMYPKRCIHHDIRLPKNKNWVDWALEYDNDEIYLFEVKHYRFSFKNTSIADINDICNSEIIKIIEALDQIKKNIEAIDNEPILLKFKNKLLTYFVVFFNFPFIKIDLLDNLIKKTLIKKRLNDLWDWYELTKDSIYFLNIEDLEAITSLADQLNENLISIKDILNEVKKQCSENIVEVMHDLTKNKDKLSSRYLNNIFTNYIIQFDNQNKRSAENQLLRQILGKNCYRR